jgi:hypothetical protein
MGGIMSDTVTVTLDRAIYERLQQLQATPYNDINAVIERLLFHAGRNSPAAVELAAEEKHYTFEEEWERAREGVYDGSGIGT